ncbi:FG-GAP repeat domain-containing protein [Phytoactinopolyspora halotolerans]|uniref:VCBS repeat-containing protein n=1 Tax=Phytoactinopolyspora halotolerans TaxID=1981512 RepID=A0A6L9SDD4_9ACTN|nr:VCBS repeat-containing protein [Phytoactinopolyspora halotolerans]NEE03266.1 VCBS repeat-containing protein [Phytoactinopolyspora halotolerans]
MFSKRHSIVAVLTTCAMMMTAPAVASGDDTHEPQSRHEAPRPGHDYSISVEEQTTQKGLWEPLLGMFGHTSAAADVNGDGWVDLYVGGFYQQLPWDRFFRGEIDDRGATEISPDRLLLGGPDGFEPDPTFPEMRDGSSSGSAFADLDNDGDLDLLVSHYYPYEFASQDPPPTNGQQVVALRNDDGRFTRVGQVADEVAARSLAIADVDGDGNQDFFVIEDVYYEDDLGPASSRLYLGDGAFGFEEATSASGLPDDLSGLGVVAADLNADGWPDLFVSGSLRGKDVPDGEGTYQRARIFINDGGDGFIEADGSEFTMVSQRWLDESAGVAVGDLNRDGLHDIVVGSHPYPALNTLWPQPVHIYLNQGNDEDGLPTFADVTAETGIGAVDTKPAHVTLADMDNDGWLDIVTGVSVGDGTEPAIFRHAGVDGGIPQFDTPSGLHDERLPSPEVAEWDRIGITRYWPTGVNADFDNDGRVDLFGVEWFPDLPSRYWENTSTAGNWLKVDVSAESALGSTVNVYRPGDRQRGKPPIFSRQVLSTESYGGGALHTLHVGLGSLRAVEVEVIGTAPTRERATLHARAGETIHVDL